MESLDACLRGARAHFERPRVCKRGRAKHSSASSLHGRRAARLRRQVWASNSLGSRHRTPPPLPPPPPPPPPPPVRPLDRSRTRTDPEDNDVGRGSAYTSRARARSR